MGFPHRVFLLVSLATLAVPTMGDLALPVPGLALARDGLTLQHRHFDFERAATVVYEGVEYDVTVHEADVYVRPLTVDVVVRATVTPAPSEDAVRSVLAWALPQSPVPLLGHRVQQDGSAFEVAATFPSLALVLLTPEHEALLAPFEA